MGCAKEKITPVFGVKKISDQISNVNMQVSTGTVQIGGQFDGIGSNVQARPIAQVVRRLAEILADIEIQRGQVGKMKLGPYQYTLNEIDGISFEFIKEIVIRRLKLQMNTRPKKEMESTLIFTDEQDFNFLKNLEIYIRFEDELTGPASDSSQTQNIDFQEKENGVDPDATTDGSVVTDSTNSGPADELFKDAFLAFSYQKGVQAMACGRKCIELYPHDLNWKARLEKNRTFSILVKLDVTKAPKEEFDFEGIIDFSVGLNLDL